MALGETFYFSANQSWVIRENLAWSEKNSKEGKKDTSIR